MKKEELAELLNGREYRSEITKEEIKQAKDNGLVVVFGASDDLIELEGAISEEFGTTAAFDKEGNPFEPCDDGCEHSQKAYKNANIIDGDYGRNGWIFKTKIPHTTFDIKEDGEQYCKGLVFSINDLK